MSYILSLVRSPLGMEGGFELMVLIFLAFLLTLIAGLLQSVFNPWSLKKKLLAIVAIVFFILLTIVSVKYVIIITFIGTYPVVVYSILICCLVIIFLVGAKKCWVA